MTKVNPFLQFLKSVEKPRDALLIFDVDLAIQPSMSTVTTPEQRQHMWDLYDMTDGGVLFFTGRTHQSVNKTFGHDYAGVFEHYSAARFGHGQGIVFMAPEVDIAQMGQLAREGISATSPMHIVADPSEINKRIDQAVFVEEKNTSIALVHTLRKDSAESAIAHLAAMRAVLQPVAKEIVERMGLQETHEVKTGGDAVEIVPKGLSNTSLAHVHLPKNEILRIHEAGLSKATAIHNFQTFYPDRRMIVTGDSDPDLKAMVESKNHYDGQGVYVSNGIPLKSIYDNAVDHHIDHFTMTWPMIGAASIALREAAPKMSIPKGFIGPSTPSLQ